MQCGTHRLLRNMRLRLPATDWLRPAAYGMRRGNLRTYETLLEIDVFPTGFRTSCLHVRTGKGLRRGAGRPRPWKTRNRQFRKLPGEPPDFRSSDQADARRSDASTRLSLLDPTPSLTSQNL